VFSNTKHQTKELETVSLIAYYGIYEQRENQWEKKNLWPTRRSKNYQKLLANFMIYPRTHIFRVVCRYDVRNLLDDRDQFKKVAYTMTRKSEDIEQEKLCDEERWADLDSEFEDLYDMSEEERDGYVGMNIINQFIKLIFYNIRFMNCKRIKY